jgi:2-keto-4-pentenoate hydratase/2-oxohepta-3-ene-1,7-dioic acid hydratase in catechol pathway
MGKSCTSQLILSAGYLVSHLLAITALPAGDIIFTGTPGVSARVEGIGTIRQDAIAAS